MTNTAVTDQGMAARRWVESHFSAGPYLERIKRLYDEELLRD